jgi:hypothetical protein
MKGYGTMKITFRNILLIVLLELAIATLGAVLALVMLGVN